ncbi:MAG: hypothetical protein CVU39_17260 [Chloroflexi bacterium HGW-Chloroflexi-10]|nr:MAG: hypothetical protein CVU39_17260 [Chloroflexi bacterium HGW-Chloroflexi-10]
MKWILRSLFILTVMSALALGWFGAQQNGLLDGLQPSQMEGRGGGDRPEMSTNGTMLEDEGTRPQMPAGGLEGVHGHKGSGLSLARLLPGMGETLLKMLVVIAVVLIGWRGSAWVIRNIKKPAVVNTNS